MAPLVPQEVLTRRKRGFDIPLNRWLGTSFDPDATVLPGLRPRALRAFANEHRAGRADHSRLFWALRVAQRFAPPEPIVPERAHWSPMAEAPLGRGMASDFAPSGLSLQT